MCSTISMKTVINGGHPSPVNVNKWMTRGGKVMVSPNFKVGLASSNQNGCVRLEISLARLAAKKQSFFLENCFQIFPRWKFGWGRHIFGQVKTLRLAQHVCRDLHFQRHRRLSIDLLPPRRFFFCRRTTSLRSKTCHPIGRSINPIWPAGRVKVNLTCQKKM